MSEEPKLHGWITVEYAIKLKNELDYFIFHNAHKDPEGFKRGVDAIKKPSMVQDHYG